MYKFLIILGLFFYFTPSKALSIVTKPTLSFTQDSVGFPIYPLTLKEEAIIKKDLARAKKDANAVLWLIPLGLLLFGIGGILRVIFGVKSYLAILKIEKQIAHYPEDDELHEEFEQTKQRVQLAFFMMISWSVLIGLAFLLFLGAIIGGGSIAGVLVGFSAFFGVLLFLMLDFFVFKTNKIE